MEQKRGESCGHMDWGDTWSLGAQINWISLFLRIERVVAVLFHWDRSTSRRASCHVRSDRSYTTCPRGLMKMSSLNLDFQKRGRGGGGEKKRKKKERKWLVASHHNVIPRVQPLLSATAVMVIGPFLIHGLTHRRPAGGENEPSERCTPSARD